MDCIRRCAATDCLAVLLLIPATAQAQSYKVEIGHVDLNDAVLEGFGGTVKVVLPAVRVLHPDVGIIAENMRRARTSSWALTGVLRSACPSPAPSGAIRGIGIP